ncbi:MAG: hypothetical protein HYY93_01530 [Planctomycetes bacterium]|nr:hypothetical protein [Planctomycetota bacterium]
MYANFDDVRLYANHNGTLPGCTADGSEMDRGAPGASLPWSEGFNWDPPGVPEPNSAVSIDDTVTDYAYAPSLDVTSAVTVLSLDLRNTSPGALTLVASANPLSITRDIGFGVAGGATSGSISSTNGRTIRVGGDWTLHTGSAFGAGTGAVEFNGGIAQSIAGSGSTTFGNLSVNPGVTGTVLTVNPASGVVTTVSGTLSVAPLQELVVASNRTLVVASAGSSGTAVNVDGILTLTNGSTLDLEGKAAPDFTSLSVAAGGLLRTSGTTSSSRAMITSSDVAIDGDGYAITVAEGSGVNLDLYDVRYPGVDGFRVNGAAALAGLDNGRFDYPSIGGVLLNFTAHSHALLQTISGCDFRNTGGATGAFNVRGGAGAGQHGIITFTDVTGAFSGEAFDDDPQALVVWPDTPGPVVPELVVAIAEDASGGGMGIQFGDRVILTFDDPTNEYDVTQSPGVDANLILSGGHSWGSIISAVWTTPSTLTLTLGSGATVVAGDSMTFAANTVESTSGGYDATDTPVTIITGTFGADTPDMDLAWADDPEATQVGGAETGDVVVVRFTRPVNAFNITSGNIDTVLRPAGGAHSWGSPISATYSGTTTPLSSAWTGGAVLNVGDTSDFPAAMAAANTVFVHGDDFTYTGKTAGTFTGVAGLSGDKDAGALIYRRDTTTLTAAYTGGGTIEVGDASAFASSVTTALTAFVSGDDFTYTGRTGTTFTGVSGLSNKNSGAPVYYGDVDTLVIRLEVGNTTATVAVTDTLTIGAYTIMDRQGINTAVGSSPSIAGDFGASLLALTGAVAADPAPETSGSGPGDIVTLTFDNPTNAYPITAGNIATTLPLAGSDPPGGPAGPTWGTIASAIWSNANRTLTITLGSGSDILAAGDAGGDNTLTVAAGTIKDSSGTNDASPVPVALSNSFGTAPLPTLQSVLAEDYSDGGPGVQDGDRVIFTFDNATDGDSTSISTLVPLTAGSWGGLQNPPPGGGSQQWLDGNRILVIYLDSTDCTISPAITQVRDNPTSSGRNAYIESSAGDPTGTDAFTSNDSLGWPRTIGGSFGAGIAGYVYDDPDSPVGVSGVMVHFIVNGEDRGAIGPTGASGFFSRSMTVAAGDRMLVYLDNGAAPYASAVTVKGAGDSIGDLNLYQDHLILRNHSGAVTANTDVATAVGAWGDLDIRFSVSGTALSLNAGPPDQTLYVLNDYAPGGTVTLGGITHVRVGNGTLSPGAIALSVTGDLRIDAGTLDMDPAGTLNVSGDLAVASGGTLDGTGVSSTLRVGGDWTMDGVYNPGSITVGFNGSGTQTISSASGTNTFSRINVGIDTSATTVVLGNDVTVSTSSSGSFVGEGTLRLNGKTLTLAGSTSYEVLSGATLQLDAGSRLAVANNATVTINPGGALQTSGTTSLSRAEITRSGTSGAYSIVVNGAVNLNCYRAIYLDANGLQIGAGATVSSFDNGEFDFPVAGGTFLNFSAYTGGARLRLVGCRFTNSPGVAGASNVTADAAEPTNEVTLAGWFGDFGGEDFDSDPNGRIDWTQDSFTLMSGGTDLATYGDLQSALDAAAANSIVESRGSGWTDLSLLPGGTATFPNQAGVILRNAFLANGSIQGSGGAAGSRGTLRNCFVALAAAGQNLGGTWTLDSVDACTVVEEVDDTIVRITADTVRNVAYTGASGEISGSQTTCSTGVVAATAFTDAARRDYHVRADASSLIDQGTNLGFAPADDIDGNLRGIDDTLTADGGDLSRWDIGADEYGAVRVGALSTPGSVPLWSSASVAGGLFGRIQAPPTYFFSNGLLYVGTSGGGAMHNSSLLALNASTGAVVRSIDLAQEIDFADDGGDNNTVASAWVSTQPIAFRYSSSPLTDIIALAVDTDDTSDGLADLDGVPDKIVFVKDDGAALSRYTAFSSNGVLDLNDGASALFQPVGPPTFALDGGSIWMFLPSAISGGGAVGYCKYDLTGARTWTYDVHPPDYRSPIFYNRMMGRSYLGLTGSADGNDTVSVNATGVGDWQRAMGSAIVNRRPMIWISQGSATSWIMAAPEASSAFAIKGDNGELRWTTPDLGGTPTSGCINPTFYSWAYVGAGEHLCKFNRVTGVLAADGDAPGEDWSTTDWLEGRMTTNLVAWSQKLFFGTERGYFSERGRGRLSVSCRGRPDHGGDADAGGGEQGVPGHR